MGGAEGSRVPRRDHWGILPQPPTEATVTDKTGDRESESPEGTQREQAPALQRDEQSSLVPTVLRGNESGRFGAEISPSSGNPENRPFQCVRDTTPIPNNDHDPGFNDP